MRAVLSFFSMLALGLMIAAVIMVAPSGNGTVTNIAGFEFAEPTLDYCRSSPGSASDCASR